MSDVVIRDARPSDDAVLGELLIDAFLTQYAKKIPEVRYDEQRKRDLRDFESKRRMGAKVLVAEVDGRIAGTVSLYPPGSAGSEAWIAGAADLRHLATHPDFHGRGLSKPLLDAIEAVAREWKVSAICLHVRKGAEGVARLYQSRGFVRDPSGDLEHPTVSLQAFSRSP